MTFAAGIFLVLVSADPVMAELPETGQERFDALQERARAAYEADALDDALEYYELMQEMVPASGEIAYNRGSILLDQGRYEQAIRVLGQALEMEFGPETGIQPVLHNRAIAFTALGAYDRALRDYDRAHELAPDDHRTLNNRGVVLLRLGEPDQAEESFLRARELQNDYPDPVFHLGNIAYDREDFGRAIDLYREVIEIAPGFDRARFNLGNALYGAGRYDDALAEFVDLYREQPDDKDVLYNLGLSALAVATDGPVSVTEGQSADADS